MSKDVFDACEGEVKLVFKESKRSSLDEANVDKRIKKKIANVANLTPNKITVENSEYSVTLPICTVTANQAIMAMKPEWNKDGTVTNTMVCKCGMSLRPSTKSGAKDQGSDLWMLIGKISSNSNYLSIYIYHHSL